MEKMKQILSGITMTLKPVQRAAIQTSPMTADEISSFELKNTALDNRVDKIVSAPLDITKADLLPSPESTYQPIRTMVRKQKRRELLSLESGILTNGFRKEEIDSAA